MGRIFWSSGKIFWTFGKIFWSSEKKAKFFGSQRGKGKVFVSIMVVLESNLGKNKKWLFSCDHSHIHINLLRLGRMVQGKVRSTVISIIMKKTRSGRKQIIKDLKESYGNSQYWPFKNFDFDGTNSELVVTKSCSYSMVEWKAVKTSESWGGKP